MPFKALGLSGPLVQGILATGYVAPTEIQAQAIPRAVAGHDLIGCAHTGTGKTAAFVLPILNHFDLHPSRGHAVRALVLTPTRELAVQVEESCRAYGRFMRLHSLAVYGGVSMQNQVRILRQGVDIVVATPGRLLDHMRQRTIDLRQVEFLVLDEADRMFDMGFINDVRTIVAAIPKKRQTMLFSATMPKEVKALAAEVLTNPEHIQVGKMTSPVESVTHSLFMASKDRKLALLHKILSDDAMESVLVFSRTKHGADRIARRLGHQGVKTIAIHSGRSQSQRLQALDGFRRGVYRVMVATDIAARGIDVQGISHVINFDLPHQPEDYIHRIGRTGRAAEKGDAISFVADDEIQYLKLIEKFMGQHIPRKPMPELSALTPDPSPQQGERPQHSGRPQQRPPHRGGQQGGHSPHRGGQQGGPSRQRGHGGQQRSYGHRGQQHAAPATSAPRPAEEPAAEPRQKRKFLWFSV